MFFFQRWNRAGPMKNGIRQGLDPVETGGSAPCPAQIESVVNVVRKHKKWSHVTYCKGTKSHIFEFGTCLKSALMSLVLHHLSMGCITPLGSCRFTRDTNHSLCGISSKKDQNKLRHRAWDQWHNGLASDMPKPSRYASHIDPIFAYFCYLSSIHPKFFPTCLETCRPLHVSTEARSNEFTTLWNEQSTTGLLNIPWGSVQICTEWVTQWLEQHTFDTFRYLSPEWLDKNHWFPIAKPPKMVRNKTHWAKRVSNDMQWYATMVMDHERPWKTIIRGLPPVSLEECGYHVVPVLMILLPKFEARFGIFVNFVAHFSDKIWSLN
jgi:hypothetical protein